MAELISYSSLILIALFVVGVELKDVTANAEPSFHSKSTPESASATNIGDKYQSDHHYANIYNSASFVTKVGSGFERLTVSIDSRLAFLSQKPASGMNATSSSDEELKKLYPFSAYQNEPFLCKTILEQLKELVIRTSDYLYKATKGQAFFRQVSILLPPSWANVNCTGTYHGSSRLLFPAEELLTASSIPTSAVYHAQSTADIHVTPDHPVYVDRPWTLQYGGCGVPGKRISIPVSFLTSGVHDPQVDLKARLLTREWIKYRYGVFDENGFDSDERYPTKHVGQSKTAQDTACVLNRPSVKTTSTINSPHANNLDYNKTRQDDMSKDSQTTKSLMSLPLDSHANEICDEHTHVRTTPTKHNFLCNGKSVWEVMRSHPDFHSHLTKGRASDFSSTTNPSRSIISAPPTSFSLGTPKMSRVIFLLDRTQAMNQNNRWINLRRAMFRMFHRVPAGVELAVISYTNVSVVSLPLTVASTQNRDHLHGRVPIKPLTTMPEDACISCALKTAVQLLKFNGDSTNPASIILITSSSNLKTREWDKISKVVESNPLRVTVVTYDDTLESGQFATLTKHGELIRISESDVDNKSRNLEQSVILNNVFLKITSEHLGSLQYKIHELVQWPNSDWQARGKFVIEEGLGRNTFVTVTPEEHGDVDGLQLISPTGREFELSLNAEGMIFLRIPGIAEHGMWSYTVKYYHNQAPRPTSIDVVTEARKSSDLISIKSWTTVHKLEQGDADVVLLYAQVTQGDLPVLNANLTVSIRLPSGSHGQDNSKIVRVRLLDTGSGYPDITWGDGIYSAYFTQFGPISGVFGVSVEVNDNNEQAVIPVHTNITRGTFDKLPCCGSSVPHISTIPTGAFNRHMAGPSFVIYQGIPLGEDHYPPGRVTDLRAEQVGDSLSEIKLSWTAPGGDFDKGQASKYEIRCYTSREALTNDNFASQGILVSSSHTPEPESYGISQNYVVPVPWRNDYFYYGIVAIDSSMNRGQVSNLVSVFIKETQTSTENLAVARMSSRSESVQNQSATNHTHTNFPRLGSMWFRGLSESELYVVLAGAGALLILTSVLILSLIWVKTNNKDEKSANSHEYQNIYRTCDNSEISRVEPYKIINNEVADFGFYWPFNCKKSAFPSKDSYQEVNKRVPPETYISVPSFYNTPLNSYVDQHNDQYCDIYASNTHGRGSCSGESKESDGESEATTQLTYDSLPNHPQNPVEQQELSLQLPCSSCDPLSCSSCANFPALVEEEKCESIAEYNESCRNEIVNNEPIYKNQQFIKNNILQAAIPRPSCGLGRTMSVCDNIGCNERPQQYSRGSMISIPNDIYGSRRKRRHVSFV